MRSMFNNLLHGLVGAGLSLGCATALAVPKAAETLDAPVSFGEAGSRPKPTAKKAAAPADKARKSSAAGKSAAPSAKASRKTRGTSGKK